MRPFFRTFIQMIEEANVDVAVLQSVKGIDELVADILLFGKHIRVLAILENLKGTRVSKQ